MKINKRSQNYLSEKVIALCSQQTKGAVLDLGCGHGITSKRLFDLGFSVTASDMDKQRFQFDQEIPFIHSNLSFPLPFSDKAFDFVLFLEVIEHLYNPDFVISEIQRVLKSDGSLFLSTPNILNVGSRMRFLFEGSFDFFREPLADYCRVFPGAFQNMHVIPWRYHELEYLLCKNKLRVAGIYTDLERMPLKFLYFFLSPFLKGQAYLKERRDRRKGNVGFQRIHRILFSRELLFGRHLIIHAKK